MTTTDNYPQPLERHYWIDEATGYPCLARANRMRAWCGYVGVPAGHPDHGKGYDDVDYHAHGGLTYADGCDGDPEGGICHVPQPGETDDVWWFGFDCAHGMDIVPSFYDSELSAGLNMPHATFKDLDYVKAEVARLAAQLAAAA